MEPRYWIVDKQGREILGLQQIWECQEEIAKLLGVPSRDIDSFNAARA
ncbi:MAG: hypothetical protein JWR69_163, partial [Pedosphaera sp.]|nr:hypothetical protein [Pedosphaera sp.]